VRILLCRTGLLGELAECRVGTKCRAEARAAALLRHSGAVATAALNELTDETLERIILSLGPNDVMPAGRHVGALMLEGAPNSSNARNGTDTA
jgi:hypothetical protein